ncbi:MAG TPA: Asd/ArgC dimerization domain-containing protein [Chlamydiales bacterium]|nr:Asd/ArgC dimerization domain-containing protein [Chlamydiales bacterium]
MHIAIIGASGLVGREIHAQLLKRRFPISSLSLFAKSSFQNIETADWSAIDLAFFAAGSTVSKCYVPQALSAGCRVIDCSSAFRSTAPLIIPEINAHLIPNARLIASPNCTTTIMLLALYPLHQRVPIKRIIASTYQAASGGGYPLMQRLQSDPLNYPLHLHTGGEEEKMRFETRKILQLPDLPISCRCVRVPVMRAHSISLHVEFVAPIENPNAILQNAPGITLVEKPTPQDASYHEDVLCDIVRCDLDNLNCLELWVVGDQLLKGAALNAVQIGEYFVPCPL